ncbi:MAG: aldo/keto reductase, partial [Huintestinicola sp.]
MKQVTKREVEKHGIETSLLGFGCMRFPTKDGKIDRERAEKMLDEAIARGVNYIDTAWPYHSGESEPFTGSVLDKYSRDSYFLATKLPCWEVHSLEDAKRIFNEQLKRLNKDYIDFYLLHALGKDRWHEMRDMGIVEYCEELKKEGKIKYLGFSFHDSYEVFEEIARYRDW